MFFTRVKLYALLALAFVAGVLGIYFSGVQRGIDKQKSKIDSKRLETVGKAKEVRDEVDSDPYLVDRANQWVRKDK